MDIFSLLSIAVILAALFIGLRSRYDLVPVLILSNLAIFLLTILSPPVMNIYSVQFDLGFRPVYLSSLESIYTLFTQMFVHADLVHVALNMLFLYLIGMPLEARIGKKRFVVIYLIAGVFGALLQSLFETANPLILMLGASGAISGAMGAMLLLYPRDEIPMFLGPIFMQRVPVWASVLTWLGIQIFYQIFYANSAVAYAAHIGGFASGMIVAQLVASRGKVAVKVERKANFDNLDALATTPELKNALSIIKTETQPDIRKAWLEYFAERAQCPKCKAKLVLEGNRLICPCEFQLDWK